MVALLLLLILCALVIAALALVLYLKRRETELLTAELRRIRTDHLCSLLTVMIPSPESEQLVEEINQTLLAKRDAIAEYRRADLELRHAIENISHDLRTPLTSILGYVQLIESEETSEEDKRRYLQIVEQRCRVLQRLITSFYDLSRLQAGEYRLEMEKLNLSELLCELVAAFYDDFTCKGIEPDIEISPRLMAHADRDASVRIFTNLMQNALRYAHSRISVRLYQSGDQVTLEMSNDAPGLIQEDADRLFERFFTADRVRSGQNTGLGLAITKTLAEQMGGSVYAELSQETLTIRVLWLS